jgi:hypothetical protein
MEKLDTHYYDGKIQADFTLPTVPPEGIDKELSLLFTHLARHPKCSPAAAQNYRIIASKGPGNYDSTGRWSADHLLYACALLAKKRDYDSDILEQICIQLQEMSGGMCPQGRCTRLVQVLYSN